MIVDSGRAVYRKDGTIEDLIVDDKLLLTEPHTSRDLRLAVVFAGPGPAVMRPTPLPDDHGDFDLAAANIWNALTRGKWADHVPAAERTFEHELLVCGGEPGQAARMLRLGNDSPPRI